VTGVGGFYSVNSNYNHTRLAHVKMANTVTELLEYAFSGCTNLSKIELSNSLKTLGTHCFENCTSLTDLILPATVSGINAGAFLGCTRLSSINTDSNAYFDIINNCLVTNDTIIFGIFSADTAIPTDSTITKIASECFTANNYLVQDLVIPENIVSIGSDAFKSCNGIIMS
jgi:hypothetical protein